MGSSPEYMKEYREKNKAKINHSFTGDHCRQPFVRHYPDPVHRAILVY